MEIRDGGVVDEASFKIFDAVPNQDRMPPNRFATPASVRKGAAVQCVQANIFVPLSNTFYDTMALCPAGLSNACCCTRARSLRKLADLPVPAPL